MTTSSHQPGGIVVGPFVIRPTEAGMWEVSYAITGDLFRVCRNRDLAVMAAQKYVRDTRA